MNGFYWIYLVLLVCLVVYEQLIRKEDRRLLYYAAVGFLLLMFVAQDYSVSIDIAEYMRQYRIIPDLSFGQMLLHKFEIGYVLLCWILERVFTSERVLLLAVGMLILIPFGISFERETENPMLALMAFVALGMYMHAIIFWRQLIAMGILTFSYRFIRERKLIPFAVLVLLAMTFHKVSVVFFGLYLIYMVPINKWLLAGCAVGAALFSLFGSYIIEFGIAVIYPRYTDIPRLNMGGGTLLALLWVVTMLSYWVFRDRLKDDRIRLPFLMVLIAATIQPVCFAYYNWLRVVLFFRVALVPMSALLYQALFQQTDGNPMLELLGKISPSGAEKIKPLYGRSWFAIATQLAMFAVLFVWYVSELEDAVYVMAPIVR